MKIEEIRYAMNRMSRTGTIGSLKLSPLGIIQPISRKPSQVVLTEMHTLAMNMKLEAIPDTMENFAAFLSIRRKA